MIMARKIKLCLVALIIASYCAAASAQETPPLTRDNLAVAQDLLRAFYPEMSDRNYFMTFETSLHYDKPSDPFGGWLQLSVGEGPKEELVIYGNDGVAYKQFLSAGFHFDKSGHLLHFQAKGPAVGDPAAQTAFAKSMQSGKIKGGRELIAALKRAGAEYGPDDKEAFVKSLPIRRLETFLGKLEVISVEFDPFAEGDRADFNDQMCLGASEN